MISPDELDALEAAAHGVTGVGCVAIDPDYVAPPGPSPAEAEFLALAPLVLRLVSAQRNAEQPAPRLLDVWRENERLRKRVAELEAEAAKEAAATHALAEEHERQGMDLAFHRHGHNAALARIAELEAGLPAVWRALTDGQRYELSHGCCHGCGSLDTGCQCWNDE